MPRPVKLRHVCKMPSYTAFAPLEGESGESITLTIDEYETVRLIDLEGCTQEECAEQMHVARTTVQGIYIEARRKLAEFLVNGKRLAIEGGEYKICGGSMCGKRMRRGCCKEECVHNVKISNEEMNGMKIAVPVDEAKLDSGVCMSYGRTPYFAIYDMETGEYEYVDNAAQASAGGAGIMASQLLIDRGVGVVVTPRLGQNAADVLKAAGVEILASIEGTLSENVDAYIGGQLSELTNIHAGFHGHQQ